MDGLNAEKALPAHVDARDADALQAQQKAIQWVGRYYLAIAGMLVLQGLAHEFATSTTEFEVKTIVLYFLVWLILSRDRLDNNIMTRLKLVCGFWLYAGLEFLIIGWQIGTLDLLLAGLNTYVLLKPAPRFVYILNHAFYLLLIAAMLVGICVTAFGTGMGGN